MAQYFVGLPLKYFGIRGEFLLVLHHWAFQKFRWRFNQRFPREEDTCFVIARSWELGAGKLAPRDALENGRQYLKPHFFWCLEREAYKLQAPSSKL